MKRREFVGMVVALCPLAPVVGALAASPPRYTAEHWGPIHEGGETAEDMWVRLHREEFDRFTQGTLREIAQGLGIPVDRLTEGVRP